MGTLPILTLAIVSAEGISEPAARAKAAAILNKLEPSRIFVVEDTRACSYALRVLRINVLPNKVEFVLTNADAPETPDAALVRYLSPESLKCPLGTTALTSPVPVLVYRAGLEPG